MKLWVWDDILSLGATSYFISSRVYLISWQSAILLLYIATRENPAIYCVGIYDNCPLFLSLAKPSKTHPTSLSLSLSQLLQRWNRSNSLYTYLLIIWDFEITFNYLNYWRILIGYFYKLNSKWTKLRKKAENLKLKLNVSIWVYQGDKSKFTQFCCIFVVFLLRLQMVSLYFK